MKGRKLVKRGYASITRPKSVRMAHIKSGGRWRRKEIGLCGACKTVGCEGLLAVKAYRNQIMHQVSEFPTILNALGPSLHSHLLISIA